MIAHYNSTLHIYLPHLIANTNECHNFHEHAIKCMHTTMATLSMAAVQGVLMRTTQRGQIKAEECKKSLIGHDYARWVYSNVGLRMYYIWVA